MSASAGEASLAESVQRLREAVQRLASEAQRLQRNLNYVHQLQTSLAVTSQQWLEEGKPAKDD